MSRARQRLGGWGEDRAAAWYEAEGYEVLARNWRCRHGEIDLVCARDGVVVIAEVKTRRSAAYGHPAEAVTPAKARRLRKLGALWLAQAGGPGWAEVRFDVVAILGAELDVIQGAF